MEQLSNFDKMLSWRLTLSPTSTWWQAARFSAHAGDGPYVFGGLVVVHLLGWLGNSSTLLWAPIIIALIVFLAIALVTLIKFMVRRQRPAPPGEFVVFQYDLYSFPSGHSARLAALAVSTAFFQPSLGWLFGGIAVAVGLARIAVGVHYVGDVVVGLSVGTLAGWGAVAFLPLLPLPIS